MIYEANIYSDNNFGSKIDIFKSTKVKVEKRSRVIKAPVENGQQSFDNKVIDPIIIRVTGVIDCTDPNSDNALDVIDKMFFSRDFEFYSVSSRMGRMTISSFKMRRTTRIRIVLTGLSLNLCLLKRC